MSVSPAVREFLAQAERAAGLSGGDYAELAGLRLQVGAVEYGDNYRTRSLYELLGEMIEEILDVGTWGGLAADVAISQGQMDLVAELLDVAAQAVRLHARLASARKHVSA